MICRCFGRTLDLDQLTRRLHQTAQLMVGLPDYEAYVAHATTAHPGDEPMTKTEFFRERQSARYGAGFRCC